MSKDSYFYFKDFKVKQRPGVFKIGTDGVIAGLLAECESNQRILEVGTGTGLISLLLANRYPDVSIVAIDLQKEAADLAGENFADSPFASRLTALQADFLEFQSIEPFDLIISNPPYFLPNQQTPDKKRQIARQTTHLSAEHLLNKAPLLLTESGRLSIIAPNLPVNPAMKLIKQTFIRSFPNSPTIRMFGTYGLEHAPLEKETDILTLYEPDQSRSAQYQHLSQNFYLK